MKKGKIINHVGFFSLKKKKKIVLRTNHRRFERIEVEFECLENDWDVLRISRTDDLFLIKKKKGKIPQTCLGRGRKIFTVRTTSVIRDVAKILSQVHCSFRRKILEKYRLRSLF